MDNRTKLSHFFSMFFVSALAIVIMNYICYFYNDPPFTRNNFYGYTSCKYETKIHNPYRKEGYGNVDIDKYGFNNCVNFTKDEAEIVCMGSSQTLSLGLNTAQNYVSLLNQDGKNCNVYNVGIGGSYLNDSLYRSPLIKKHFPNCKAVVIETPYFPNLDDLKNMEKVLAYRDVPIVNYDKKYANAILKFMLHTPVFRMIYQSLNGIWNNEKGNKVNKQSNAYKESDQSDYELLADKVFKLSRQQLGNMPVIIMYIPQYKLDRDGNINLQVVPEQEQAIEAACRANNFTYLSLGPALVEEYNKNRILAFGFTNSHIGSGHLNADGNRIVANVLEKVLRKEGVFQ